MKSSTLSNNSNGSSTPELYNVISSVTLTPPNTQAVAEVTLEPAEYKVTMSNNSLEFPMKVDIDVPNVCELVSVEVEPGQTLTQNFKLSPDNKYREFIFTIVGWPGSAGQATLFKL